MLVLAKVICRYAMPSRVYFDMRSMLCKALVVHSMKNTCFVYNHTVLSHVCIVGEGNIFFSGKEV